MSALRTLLAPNPSPMTLDGTRSYVVGLRRAAVIDPGPDDPRHIEALAQAVAEAEQVAILLTHRHPDHAAGAPALAAALGGRVSSGPVVPSEGDVIPTDAGDLFALATPGHTPDHCALHWPAESAIFCGDLMMGGLDTALVAAGEGDLGDYLDSLDRLRRLAVETLYPAHGPPFTDPDTAIARYLEHRSARERQVLGALAGGARGLREIAEQVYGGVAPDLRDWVELTVRAYLEHLESTGRVNAEDWR